MTFANPVNLRASLNLSPDNFSPALDRATRSLGNFEGGLGRVGRGTGQLAQGFARIGAIAGTALVGGIVASVKVAADFEEQLRTINTIALATPDQLDAIGSGIRRLAVEHGGDLNDLTKAYYDLLSAGIDVADAQGVLNQATLLSIGTLGTTSQAVDVLTTALNAYGLEGKDAARISEELAVAVRDGKVTLDQIAPTYANVAAIAAQAGIGTDEIAAAFARLTAQGTDAASVTTQMSRAIVELLSPTSQLLDLQERTGIVFSEVADERGLVQALELMRQKAEALGIPFIELFGRVEAYKFALQTTGPAHQAYLDELGAVQTSTGVLAAQVGEREQGLAFQFNKLKASIREVGIVIGSALLPELTPLITDFAAFVTNKAPQIEAFARDLAGGIREVVAEIKQADFSGFTGALEIMAQVGGKVVDLFRSLPPELQALAITGLALNKLSGGLLGAGAGNIAGGLIQIVFQRGASPANPLWVQSATGGVGGGGVGGGVTPLGAALTIVGGAAIGTAIGRELIAPILQPAVDTETRRFAATGMGGSQAEMTRNLEAINAGIDDLNALGIAKFAFLPELQLLESQRDQLQRLITVGQTGEAQRVQRDAAISATRAQESARHLQSLATANVRLQNIEAKPMTVNTTVNTSVTVSASQVMTTVQRTTSLIGGHQADAP